MNDSAIRPARFDSSVVNRIEIVPFRMTNVGLRAAPSLHVAERQDVVAWVPAYVRGDRRSVRNVTE